MNAKVIRMPSAQDRAGSLFERAANAAREGERLKRESVELVDRANALWVDVAVAKAKGIIRELASGGDFTADSIYPLMGGLICKEPRAMGAVMTRLQAAGLIETTDRTVKSNRPECHRRPIRVWRVR